MDPKLFLRIVPQRRQQFHLSLQKSVEILQMPQVELSQWLYQEIEKNPLLELESGKKDALLFDPVYLPSLHEHLLEQIREHFDVGDERRIAEQFVFSLDEKGFVSEGPKFPDHLLEKIPGVLATLQTFDPPGIFARSLRESLLLQLRAKGKSGVCCEIVQNHFEDLLHGRYRAIEKKLGLESLREPMRELSTLSLRPAGAFRVESPVYVAVDMQVSEVDGGFTLELKEEELPKFHLKTEYLDVEVGSLEEKEALRSFKTQAKWLIRSLDRRRALLCKIGKVLVNKQSRYLSQKGALTPLSAKELALKLDVHESTLSRILSGKYIATPLGVMPLADLVHTPPEASAILQKLIASEDKNCPMTDEELAEELRKNGFSVARRTVAKYRGQLNIRSAARRKRA